MFYFIYNLLLLVLAPCIICYHWYRSYSRKRPAAFSERFVITLPQGLPEDTRPRIWIHAVSVGEVIASRPLLLALRLEYPGHCLIMTTMTETGRSVAASYPVDALYYIPFDFTWSVRRFITAINPNLVIIMETELWPNLNRELLSRAIPLVLANGRISDNSFAGYRRLRWFFTHALAPFSRICVQTVQDAERFIAIGGAAHTVVVTGNLKYDIPYGKTSVEQRHDLRARFGLADASCIVTAGSTHAGEEQLVLEAFEQCRRIGKAVQLVLVPRHPERIESVVSVVLEAGFRAVRRSQLGSGAPLLNDTDVLVVDTVGELMDFYRLADLAIVGGSLVAHGGHNILEPIAVGVCVVFGQHMENFREVAALARHYQAGEQVTVDTLAETVCHLVADRSLRDRVAVQGLHLMEQQGGAVTRHLSEIRSVYRSS